MTIKLRTSKFPLGTIVATPGALQALPDQRVLSAMLVAHASGDWGEVDAEDKASNDRALLEGERLLSAYKTPEGVRVWVITERDRSTTTILLPEEY